MLRSTVLASDDLVQVELAASSVVFEVPLRLLGCEIVDDRTKDFGLWALLSWQTLVQVPERPPCCRVLFFPRLVQFCVRVSRWVGQQNSTYQLFHCAGQSLK